MLKQNIKQIIIAMNVFDTNYATVFLEKNERMVKLRWNGYVRDFQYNLVIDLIIQLIPKYQINTLVEDQTLLRLSGNSKVHSLYELVYSEKFKHYTRELLSG